MTFPNARERAAHQHQLDALQAKHPGENVFLFDGTTASAEGPRAHRSEADDPAIDERPTDASRSALEEAIARGDAIDAGLLPDPTMPE
jgi:hypothetical protein